MTDLLALACGAAAGLSLGLTPLLALKPQRRQPPSRAVVQLAIRLASRGQRIVLVESGSRLCLARAAHATMPDLRVLGIVAAGRGAVVAGRREDHGTVVNS